MLSRDAILAALRAKPGSGPAAPEVLIIGAGINGVGVFRDLALQGVSALLVDMGDVCSATSSASSRLIHGGLRYLEIGEFSLVRESVEERNRLLLDALGHREQAMARLGQHEAVGLAVEQLEGKVLLQLADASGDRRVVHLQPPRGGHQPALPRQFEEEDQVVPVEHG